MSISLARAFVAAMLFSCLNVAAAVAATQPKPTQAMMAPIERIVTFVNTGTKIPTGTYAGASTITDEFAPFHWTAGNIGLQWSERFTVSNSAAKITDPHIVLGAPTEFVRTSDRAYIVFPGRFTPLLDGKPFTETGYWTFVVVRDGAVWCVASQAWAGVSFH
jgi:hypothetical protein